MKATPCPADLLPLLGPYTCRYGGQFRARWGQGYGPGFTFCRVGGAEGLLLTDPEALRRQVDFGTFTKLITT